MSRPTGRDARYWQQVHACRVASRWILRKARDDERLGGGAALPSNGPLFAQLDACLARLDAVSRLEVSPSVDVRAHPDEHEVFGLWLVARRLCPDCGALSDHRVPVDDGVAHVGVGVDSHVVQNHRILDRGAILYRDTRPQYGVSHGAPDDTTW